MNIQPFFAARPSHVQMVTPGTGPEAADLRACLEANRSDVSALVRRHGGVVFRGFAPGDAGCFRACAEALGATPLTYVGGNTPRDRVAADVFTSTEFPATETIALHNEMSYLPEWPRRVFFYSAVPAACGGQTSLIDGRDVLGALPGSIVRQFRDKRVRYIRHFHPSRRLGKTWQATYQTEDRAEAERLAASQGSVCTWLPEGVLRVTTSCDAVIGHPETGEHVWFNQAEQWHPSALRPDVRAMLTGLLGRGRMPHDCEYGDGEPLDEEVLAEIRRTQEHGKLLCDWRAGDLLVLDNVFMMHGREPFAGTRKTLAYLSAS